MSPNRMSSSSASETVSSRSASELTHRLALVLLVAAILLVATAFVLMTPFIDLSQEIRQRDDDAVLSIRVFCFGVIGLGTLGAFLATTTSSFQRRPKASVGIVLAAALIVLAGIFRIYQTVGI